MAFWDHKIIFFGSAALLDGYCDESQYFIDTFTVARDALTIECNASEVAQALTNVSNTG